jgi:hypothetical protein
MKGAVISRNEILIKTLQYKSYAHEQFIAEWVVGVTDI